MLSVFHAMMILASSDNEPVIAMSSSARRPRFGVTGPAQIARGWLISPIVSSMGYLLRQVPLTVHTLMQYAHNENAVAL